MWVHCNKCGVNKSANNRVKFYVGLCSHVLCEECNSSKTCPIHKRPFQGIEVNNSMPYKMRVYLEDPDKLLTSWQKCIRFQCEQRTLYESREWTTNTENTRKLKEQISVLNRYKEFAIKAIEKDTKCINKMKAIIAYHAQNISLFESHSASTSRTSKSLNQAQNLSLFGSHSASTSRTSKSLNQAQNLSLFESHSASTSRTSKSLNALNALGESGVDMHFDDSSN